MATQVRKAVLRRRLIRRAEGLVARDLSATELLSMDRDHWTRSESFVSNGSAAYLVRRFLNCPTRAYRVFGITDHQANRIEGLVVTYGTIRINVVECTVNESVTSEVQAVELATNAIPTAESVMIPLLPQSNLASEFATTGYIARAMKHADHITGNTWWSAYWLMTHPLASSFAEIKRWTLWYAWSHH
jgi:hypothetical protein